MIYVILFDLYLSGTGSYSTLGELPVINIPVSNPKSGPPECSISRRPGTLKHRITNP